MIEEFAVGADLDFGLLAGGEDFGLVGDDRAVLGDGFDFDDFAVAGFLFEAIADGGGERLKRDLLFEN